MNDQALLDLGAKEMVQVQQIVARVSKALPKVVSILLVALLGPLRPGRRRSKRKAALPALEIFGQIAGQLGLRRNQQLLFSLQKLDPARKSPQESPASGAALQGL